MNSRTQLSYTNSILEAADAGKISRKEAANMLLSLESMWLPEDLDCGGWTNAEIKLHLESLGVVFEGFDEELLADAESGPDEGSAAHFYDLHRDFWGIAPTLYAAYCPGKGWNCYAKSLEGSVEIAWEYYAPHISPCYWIDLSATAVQREAA